MEIYDIIGYSAMILIIISYIPQIVKIHITKKTEDISLGTYILLGVSLALWPWNVEVLIIEAVTFWPIRVFSESRK